MKKKLLSNSALEEVSVKNLKSYLLVMVLTAVMWVVVICGSYIINKVYKEKFYIQFLCGFVLR